MDTIIINDFCAERVESIIFPTHKLHYFSHVSAYALFCGARRVDVNIIFPSTVFIPQEECFIAKLRDFVSV